jgi:hypothetical protein
MDAHGRGEGVVGEREADLLEGLAPRRVGGRLVEVLGAAAGEGGLTSVWLLSVCRPEKGVEGGHTAAEGLGAHGEHDAKFAVAVGVEEEEDRGAAGQREGEVVCWWRDVGAQAGDCLLHSNQPW